MIPTSALLLPFALQAAAMAVDELHFHRRRGLGRWERVGHPLDTASAALAYAWLIAVPPAPDATWVFLALCALSCFLVTKDEAIHAKECSAGEHWFHSALFILHPLTFASAYSFWTELHDGASEARSIAVAGLGAITAFFLYQALFWNLASRRRREAQ